MKREEAHATVKERAEEAARDAERGARAAAAKEEEAIKTNTARAEEAARDECREYVQRWEDEEGRWMDEATYLEIQATFERKYGGGG